MGNQQNKQQYQGPERRRSQTQYQGEERRRPAPVTGMRSGDEEERRRQEQTRFDDIH